MHAVQLYPGHALLFAVLVEQVGYLQSLLRMCKGWQANQQGQEAQPAQANLYRCFHKLVYISVETVSCLSLPP